MKKVICPNCKSENLSYYSEFCFTEYYALDKYNQPTKRCIRKTNPENDIMPYNWECKDCGCIFGGTNTTISCDYKEVE